MASKKWQYLVNIESNNESNWELYTFPESWHVWPTGAKDVIKLWKLNGRLIGLQVIDNYCHIVEKYIPEEQVLMIMLQVKARHV